MGKITKLFIASPENNYRPPALSYKAIIFYALTLLLIRLLLAVIPAESAAVDSQTLMGLINKERENRNLGTLFTHQSLVSAAESKSADMINRDYFAHQDPDGNYVWPTIVAAGYSPYRILGENLALDFITSEGMVQAWLDSPTHRDNLLNPEFFDQGLIALYGDYKGKYTNLTTSLFGTLAVQQSPPPPAVVPPTATPNPSPTPPAQVPPPTPAPTPPSQPQESEPPDQSEKPPATPSQAPGSSSSEQASTSVPAKVPGSLANLNLNFEFPQFRSPKTGEISEYQISRAIFTFFAIGLLIVFAVNSIIIFRHKAEEVVRSHGSYHTLIIIAVIIISILIWWWQ